jgi:hypothetical protein
MVGHVMPGEQGHMTIMIIKKRCRKLIKNGGKVK